MKKLSVLTACFAAVLMMSAVSFSQEYDESEALPDLVAPDLVADLSIEEIIGEARSSMVPQAQPFGCPPYPAVNGYPAYGIPYSYPRGAFRARLAQRPRRLLARFAPPPHQPYPLQAPGIAAPGVMPGMVPPGMRMAPAPMAQAAAPAILGQVPCQETLGVCPAYPAPMEPNVFYRPTPIKNFLTLITAPRPYIGYDPYAGYPPFPGYVPPL